jgi:hypothetical protein
MCEKLSLPHFIAERRVFKHLFWSLWTADFKKVRRRPRGSAAK